jgi:ribosomal protein S1
MSRQNEPSARNFLARCTVGDVLEGTVASVVPFGAFVEVADGVHGLLHRSEWNAQPELGAPVRVTILDVDVDNARMSLRPA